MAPMPMPEAAMHQDDSLILRKYNVWVAREVFRVESISEAKLVEGFSDLQFGGSVFAPNTRHDPGAGLSIDSVHHTPEISRVATKAFR